MEVLDLVEQRIDALNQILGSLPNQDVKGSENFTDSVLSANILISSAMSGREQTSQVIKRTKELECYLDPNYLDEHQAVKSKEVYVNTIAPELAGSLELLDKVKTLESTLGAEYFRNIPNENEKLKKLNDNMSELKQSNEIIEESLMIAMKHYSTVHENIEDSLKAMNERLDKIEDKLQKKKCLDIAK